MSGANKLKIRLREGLRKEAHKEEVDTLSREKNTENESDIQCSEEKKRPTVYCEGIGIGNENKRKKKADESHTQSSKRTERTYCLLRRNQESDTQCSKKNRKDLLSISKESISKRKKKTEKKQ